MLHRLLNSESLLLRDLPEIIKQVFELLVTLLLLVHHSPEQVFPVCVKVAIIAIVLGDLPRYRSVLWIA